MFDQINGLIRIGNYQFSKNKVLGKGASGCVYKGHRLGSNQSVAIKAIDMSQITNEVTRYLLEGQKKAMNSIKSPYVAKTHEIIQQKDYCYIIMEQCTQGTLKNLIFKKGRLQDDEALEILRKIVIGYVAISDNLFIHRDLKTANILIKENGDPAIIDFGYCEMIMGHRPMIQYNVGSPSYMSPEAYTKSRYSQKSDIWSLGVILYEMLTGKTLDNGMDIKAFLSSVQNQGHVKLNTANFSPVMSELLQAALKVSPDERATIHRLKYIIDKSMIQVTKTRLNKKTICPSTQPTPRGELQMITHNQIAHMKPKTPKQILNKVSLSRQNLKSSINYNSVEIDNNARQIFNRNQNSSVVYTSVPSTSQPHFHRQQSIQPSPLRMPPASLNKVVSCYEGRHAMGKRPLLLQTVLGNSQRLGSSVNLKIV